MSQGAIGSSTLDQALIAQRDSVGTGNVAGLTSRFQRTYARFIDVMHMLRPPVSLLEPALMVRALLHLALLRIPAHRRGEV